MSFKFEQPVHCEIIQSSYSTYVLSKNLVSVSTIGKIHFVDTREAQLPEPPPHWSLELKSGTELPTAF